MITSLLLAGVPALLLSFLGSAWCVKGTKAKQRRCLQREYEVEQAAIANRCTDENAALFEGNLLKGLYGHFPPAPEFQPIDIRPPKLRPVVVSQAYAPVVICGKHGLKYVSDTRCPRCLDESTRALAQRCAQAPCSCGIGRQCHACAPVEIGNSEYWIVWDEKTQSVLPDVPKVVHDFGGNSNQIHV